MCQAPFYNAFHFWHYLVLTLTLSGGYHYYPSLQMRLQGPERLQSYPSLSGNRAQAPSWSWSQWRRVQVNTKWVTIWRCFSTGSDLGSSGGHLTISEDIFGCHWWCVEAMWLDQSTHTTAPIYHECWGWENLPSAILSPITASPTKSWV